MIKNSFVVGCCVLLLVAAALSSGCKSPSGAREFIPNKGWRPIK